MHSVTNALMGGLKYCLKLLTNNAVQQMHSSAPGMQIPLNGYAQHAL